MVYINHVIARQGQRSDESRRQLFDRQKAMLDLFLEKGAISRDLHDKSLRDLREKMHIA